MRVLIVNDKGTADGGAQIYCLRLREGLRRRGHTAALASAAIGLASERQADFEYAAVNGRTRAIRALRVLRNGRALSDFSMILSEWRPDLVHLRMFTNHLSLAVLPLLSETPTVFTPPGVRLSCPLALQLRPSGEACTDKQGWACVKHGCYPAVALPWLLARRILIQRHKQHIDLLIASSNWVANTLRAVGMPRVERLPHGLPLTPPVAHKSTSDVLYSGRLAAEKGVDVLIRAMKIVRGEHPQSRLLIAGDGPMRGELERLVTEQDLTRAVEFLGWVPNAELPDLHSQAAVMVVPSYGEAFGIVVSEGQMWGTPVIGSRVGGIPDNIRHGETGLLAEPGNSEDLAAQICYMLDNPTRAQEMAARAREFVERECSMEVHVDRLLELYKSVISEY